MTFCNKCSCVYPKCILHKTLADIIPQVLDDMTKMGWQPKVAEVCRTQAQENEKVKQGYSQTTHSQHVLGRAVDIVDARYGWQGPASSLIFQFWLDLGHTYKKYGLVWGGVWSYPTRWPIYEKAVRTKDQSLITWFCDVAHGQLQSTVE